MFSIEAIKIIFHTQLIESQNSECGQPTIYLYIYIYIYSYKIYFRNGVSSLFSFFLGALGDVSLNEAVVFSVRDFKQ